jgi:hypothetical protein
MAKTVFTAESKRRTEIALKTAGLKVAAAASTAEHAGAEPVAREMAARAPVDTGRLRASIHAEGSQAVAGVDYALYVEPFAAAAADAAAHEVEAAMIAVFRAALGGK